MALNLKEHLDELKAFRARLEQAIETVDPGAKAELENLNASMDAHIQKVAEAVGRGAEIVVGATKEIESEFEIPESIDA